MKKICAFRLALICGNIFIFFVHYSLTIKATLALHLIHHSQIWRICQKHSQVIPSRAISSILTFSGRDLLHEPSQDVLLSLKSEFELSLPYALRDWPSLHEGPVHIAIFGGTGLSHLTGFSPVACLPLTHPTLCTPWGTPSSPITILSYLRSPGTPLIVAFLPRHGLYHEFVPHEVPSRANIAALRKLRVRCCGQSERRGQAQGLSSAGPGFWSDQGGKSPLFSVG